MLEGRIQGHVVPTVAWADLAREHRERLPVDPLLLPVTHYWPKAPQLDPQGSVRAAVIETLRWYASACVAITHLPLRGEVRPGSDKYMVVAVGVQTLAELQLPPALWCRWVVEEHYASGAARVSGSPVPPITLALREAVIRRGEEACRSRWQGQRPVLGTARARYTQAYTRARQLALVAARSGTPSERAILEAFTAFSPSRVRAQCARIVEEEAAMYSALERRVQGGAFIW